MKLFVTDYDGTLFINDKDIKNNNTMLNKLQKHDFKVIISTGRSYPSIKNQVDIYHIPYDYLSCADGSIIFDKNGNIIKLFLMNQEIIKPFQDFYNKLNYEEIQFVYPEGYSNILKEDSNLLGINICLSTINYTEKIVNDFIKMSKEYFHYNFLNYMHPNYSYLCVKPKGITKSSAIKYLMEMHHIDKNDIYVIGDADNDLEMIRDYEGACMNTSCKEVLKISKKSYKSVHDYIADILKKS